MFLSKTLCSHSASLRPGVHEKLVAENLMLGVTLRWTSILSKGGVEILMLHGLIGHLAGMQTLLKEYYCSFLHKLHAYDARYLGSLDVD